MAAVTFISTLKSELPMTFRKRRNAALRTLPRSQRRKAEDKRESRGPRSNSWVFLERALLWSGSFQPEHQLKIRPDHPLWRRNVLCIFETLPSTYWMTTACCLQLQEPPISRHCYMSLGAKVAPVQSKWHLQYLVTKGWTADRRAQASDSICTGHQGKKRTCGFSMLIFPKDLN